MKKPLLTILSLSAFVALSACSQTGQDARQQTANGAKTSDAELTSYGKSLKMIGVYPTRAQRTANYNHFGEGPKGTCTYESRAFKATGKFGKPINLPSFGKETPEMTVTCVVDGRDMSTTVGPVNLTVEAYRAQAAGHVLFGLGLVGAAVTGGIAANRDKSKDIYGYPLQITLG